MGGNFNHSGATRVNIMREIESSLRRLQADYIDLYQADCLEQQRTARGNLADSQ
jgi:aryl-alcohol dehydrogenase-like predicted oxidoreductase